MHRNYLAPLIFFICFVFLPMFFMIGFLIHESFDYDGYEKYKKFCENNNLTMEKNSDAVSYNRCYKIIDNKIIKYYTPIELDDGIFVLKEAK